MIILPLNSVFHGTPKYGKKIWYFYCFKIKYHWYFKNIFITYFTGLSKVYIFINALISNQSFSINFSKYFC